MAGEPEQLQRGRAFHQLIQREWEDEAQGDVTSERPVKKPSGSNGRVDVFVKDDDPKGVVAVVEIKATDWDLIAPRNRRRNARRQIRQIWSYIGSQILDGRYVQGKGAEGKDVCAGIIFPQKPREPELLELIEAWFNEEGIQVVWHDEALEDCRERNQGRTPACS